MFLLHQNEINFRNGTVLIYWIFFLRILPTPEPATTEDHFRWMQDWGFNFVRIPMAYPCYLDFDRSKNITAEEVYKIKEEAVDTY